MTGAYTGAFVCCMKDDSFAGIDGHMIHVATGGIEYEVAGLQFGLLNLHAVFILIP
jgi:hypothetical protein